MKIRVKHRKLFYVPGMISLVLIPILGLCYFYYSQKSFEKLGSMDLGLPDKGSINQMKKDYPLLTNRNYKVFAFNGSLESDKAVLVKFHKSLKEFNRIKDTINGIKLCFGKQMKYEVFIRVLEIITIEMTPTYMPYGQELLIVNGAPSDKEKQRKREEEKYGKRITSFCGTQEVIYRQRLFEETQQRLIANENFQKSFFKKHWYLFLAYFGIVLLNFYALIKFNKNRKYNQKSYI